MKFLCAKLEDVGGHLVAYAQILPYEADPEVLLWSGRVFRLKFPGVADADLPVEPVPGLEGPRKVITYVEAWTAGAIATVLPDGSIVRVNHGDAAVHEPPLGGRDDHPVQPDVLTLSFVDVVLDHLEAGDVDKAANLLRDALDRKAEPMVVERDPPWDVARGRILDEWAHDLYNGRGITTVDEVVQLHRDAVAVVRHLDAIGGIELVSVPDLPPGEVARGSMAAARKLADIEARTSRSVLPMTMNDGSTIIVDAIDGGARSTDGVPDGLTLCLTDSEGNERQERYLSELSLKGQTFDTLPPER